MTLKSIIITIHNEITIIFSFYNSIYITFIKQRVIGNKQVFTM